MNRTYLLLILYILLGVNTSGFANNYIVVSKQKLMLYVVNTKQDTLCAINCAVGTNYGNKQEKGDKKTPEGTFKITKIQKSKTWTHDFNDGFGYRKGAYGPWFFRLKVPNFVGIGIHGTCFPNSIGTRSSEGCIRLRNEDILILKQFVYIGMKCIIEEDNPDNTL